MSNRGGIYTLRGVQYEIKAVVYQIISLLMGRLKAIRYQPASASLADNQLPTGVFVNDYSTEDNEGHKHFFQAKSNAQDPSWTINRLLREGVLAQFWNQHRDNPESELFFVSNIPAPQLDTLAEHARQTISSNEFQQTLNKGELDNVKQIQETLNINQEDLWRLLQKARHHLLTEEHIHELIVSYASERYGDIDKFALVLKDLVGESPGRLLDHNAVNSYLESNGLFRFPIISQDIRSVLYQASGSLRGYESSILGIHVDREETTKLEQWLDTTQDEHSVAFLLDVAGSGKSVILHDLQERLESRSIPVLALKADIDLSGNVADAKSLQSNLNLPDSPESLLAKAAAEHGKAILIIDQLDALSSTFARDQACLNTITGLVGRASSIHRVYVVVSCRSFDRKFDPKLQRIKATKEFTISPFTKLYIEQVLSILGVKWDDLTPREQGLLTNPHHLDLFATVISEGKKRSRSRNSITTVQDLYRELWELKISNPNASSITRDDLQNTIYHLVDAIHNNQELYQPLSLFDEMTETRKYLESQGVFRREGSRLSFFHQSFFDYCYARCFASQDISLAENIRKGDQGFFVRPQILQTLNYLRGVDIYRYLQELESLMDRKQINDWLRQLKMRRSRFRRSLFSVVARIVGPPIRYHLRHLVFAWFGQLTGLSLQEKTIGLSCLQSMDRCLFLSGAQGNPEWFDVIQSCLDMLFILSDEAIDKEVIPFLRSVQEDRPDQVFGAFAKQLSKSDKWDARIVWCLNLYKDWQNQAAQKCLLWLCENGQSPWYSLVLAFQNVAKANTEFGIQTLRIILDRLEKEWQQRQKPLNLQEGLEAKEIERDPVDGAAIKIYLDRMRAFEDHANQLLPRHLSWIDEIVTQAIERHPGMLLDVTLSWLEHVLPELTWDQDSDDWLKDAVFSRAYTYPSHETDSMIVMGIKESLSRLAKESKESFIDFANRLEKSNYLFLHQILLDVLTEHAMSYASWSYQYLLKSMLHFQVGDLGSATLFSRKLIGAIFPYLETDERTKLEEAILSYYPLWEQSPKGLHRRGSDQFELLWGIPDELLTPEGRKRRSELQRKFEGYKPPERHKVEVFSVGSPIPPTKAEILTDDAWLDAMHYYNGETNWGKPRERFDKGGVVELGFLVANGQKRTILV